MQPSPMAETSRPLSPSLRFCIDFHPSRSHSAWHDPDRCRSSLGVRHRSDVLRAMAAIFGTIGCVDLIAGGGIGVLEQNIFPDTAGIDATFMPNVDTSEPAGTPPIGGSDVNIATDEHHPDGHR